MISDPSKFTIIRSKWLRGMGKNTKIRCAHSGKMDCFEFLLQAAGFNIEKITDDIDEPLDIIRQYQWCSKLIEWSGNVYSQSSICCTMIKINDNPDISDLDKEFYLSGLFKTIGIELDFVD